MAEILHTMIYTGPKPEKRVEITGRLEPIIFKPGPLSETDGPLKGQKYADVTEKEGRILQRRAPGMFAWVEGTQLGPQVVSRDEFEALKDRVADLEALVRQMAIPGPAPVPAVVPQVAEFPKANGRRKKAAPVEDAPPADVNDAPVEPPADQGAPSDEPKPEEEG